MIQHILFQNIYTLKDLGGTSRMNKDEPKLTHIPVICCVCGFQLGWREVLTKRKVNIIDLHTLDQIFCNHCKLDRLKLFKKLDKNSGKN